MFWQGIIVLSLTFLIGIFIGLIIRKNSSYEYIDLDIKTITKVVLPKGTKISDGNIEYTLMGKTKLKPGYNKVKVRIK